MFENLIVAQLVKKFPPFTEPEDSLPCPQDPATGPCSDTVQSTLTTHFLSSVLIFSTPRSHGLFLRLRFSKGLYAFLISPYMVRVQTIVQLGR
jgi:hypothetical protein